MADSKISVLIVEDDPQLVRILQAILKDDGALRVAGTGRLALQMIEDAPPAIMLLDMRLPDMLGMEILKEVARRAMPVTVIVMTAHGSVDLAVDAMREGAYDFLTKPLDFERVRVMVRNAVERHRIIQELDSYKNQYERTRFRGLMGSSPAMQRLYRQLRSVGSGSAPVLIVGEQGTELESCARAVHDESTRAEKPFATREAAELDEHALAAALRELDGGTLHILRTEGLTAAARGLLLQFLKGELDDDEQPDTRVVASAEADLPTLVKSGEFEHELLLCLESSRIEIAPLRERGEDVLDLAEHLLLMESKEVGRSFNGFSDEVEMALVNHTWPGNRSELEDAIHGAVQRHEGRLLTLEMLPGEIAKKVNVGEKSSEAVPLRGLDTAGAVPPLWKVEQEAIEKALKLAGGNVLYAAKLLEVSPGTIYRKQQTWKARKL